jgi:hypothetical protein
MDDIRKMLSLFIVVTAGITQTTWAAEQATVPDDAPAHSLTKPTSGHGDPADPTWDNHLPFYGQKVTDMGMHLPDPVGLTFLGAYVDQDLSLTDLKISGDGQNFSPVPFVAFDGAAAKDIALEFKLDAWILPFLNVFAIAGVIDGKADIPVQLDVDGLLGAIGSDICSNPLPPQPDFCGGTINLDAKPKYYGYNYGGGIVLAGGWKSYFVAAPMTVVKSDLDIAESEITTYEAELLIGKSFKLNHGRVAEVFVGTSYLDVIYEATGFAPLSEIDPLLPDIYFDMNSTNKDKWNYIVGGQYALSDAWQLQFQLGFGGSRTQGTFAGSWRF